MRQEPLTFSCMTKPNLYRLERMMPSILPYIDKAIIVLGKKEEATINYLESLGPKIVMAYRPWDDNFAKQWDFHLQFVKEGWDLVCDDDELPSEKMLQSLDSYINNSNYGKNHCCVEFRCNPISEGQDMGPVNYYRQIFFRYQPGMHYKGGPKTGCHQYLVGYQKGSRIIRADETYYHIKSLKEEYENASRNYFIYGIWLHGSSDGQQREEWQELRKVLAYTNPEVKTWPEFNEVLLKGSIHNDLKVWMRTWFAKYREHAHYNEMRALPTYYFKYLHPEERIEGHN